MTIDHQTVTDMLSLFAGELAPDPGSHEGRISGRYEAISILGCDGQATVVRAFDHTLCRSVVLKIYRDGFDPQQRTRILNEGRALARIENPYVVKCHGVEEWQGIGFLVLEYIDGVPLDEYLQTVSLGRNQLLALFRQIVLGIQAAHRFGLVHRDIKPSNVLVDENGCAKVIDFGLVSASQTRQIQGDTRDTPGTPAYMPPEIATSSGTAGIRSDIFSVGAVLYFMLTRQAPFEGKDSSEEREFARRGDVTDPGELSSDLPPEVRRMCMKCLAAEPENRYADTDEILTSVELILYRRGRQRRIAMAAAVFVMLFGVAILALILQTTASRPQPNAQAKRASQTERAVIPFQKAWKNLEGEKQRILAHIGRGEWSEALEHQRIATGIARSPSFAEAFGKEEQLKLECLVSMQAAARLPDRIGFQDVLGRLAKLSRLVQENQLEEAAEYLETSDKKRLRQTLERLVGTDNVFSLMYRQKVAAIRNELAGWGLANQRETMTELLDLVLDYARVLGAESYAALYAREEVAYLHQTNGNRRAAIKSFERIYGLAAKTNDIRRRFAAFALIEQARMIAGENPARARQYLQDFLDFRDVLTESENSLTVYYAMEISHETGDFKQARDYAETVLRLVSESTESVPEKFRRVVAHAILCSVVARESATVASESEQRQLKLLALANAAKCLQILERDFPKDVDVNLLCRKLIAEGMFRIEEWKEAGHLISRMSKWLAEIDAAQFGDGLQKLELMTLVLKLDLATQTGNTDLAFQTATQVLQLEDRAEADGVFWGINVLPRCAAAIYNHGDQQRAADLIRKAHLVAMELKAMDTENSVLWDREFARIEQLMETILDRSDEVR